MAPQHGGERQPRARVKVAIEERIAVDGRQRGIGREPQGEAQSRVADGAADAEPVAGPRRLPPQDRAGRHLAEGGHADQSRAAGAHGVTAQQRAAMGAARRAETLGEAREPRFGPVVRQCESQEEAARTGALGGEIRQVHAERLAGDGAGRVVGKVVNAGYDSVGGHHEVVAGRRRQARGVVAQALGAGAAERREVARDQRLLARACHSGQPFFAGPGAAGIPNSVERTSRPTRSSTALTMPGSSPP